MVAVRPISGYLITDVMIGKTVHINFPTGSQTRTVIEIQKLDSVRMFNMMGGATASSGPRQQFDCLT